MVGVPDLSLSATMTTLGAGSSVPSDRETKTTTARSESATRECFIALLFFANERETTRACHAAQVAKRDCRPSAPPPASRNRGWSAPCPDQAGEWRLKTAGQQLPGGG